MDEMNQWLNDKQEKQRQETIEKVQSVIDFIKLTEGDNTVIFAKKLLHYGKDIGIKRAVLYKRHVLNLWNPHLWQKRYGNKRGMTNKYYDKEVKELKSENERLTKHLEKTEDRIKKLSMEISEEKELCQGIRIQLKREEKTSARLRGAVRQLQDTLAARGIAYQINVEGLDNE